MLSIQELQRAVSQGAALRRRRRLQPAHGPGVKIFPSTYPGDEDNSVPRHVYERRLVPDRGELVTCLLDSVQSQANRMEEALMAAVRTGVVEMPHVEIDFSNTGLESLDNMTDLEVPHRIFDALVRDSKFEGQKFFDSPIGQRVASALPSNAAPLLEISPATLAFGGWHTQGASGGQGVKFPRCVVSEIVAINVPVDAIEGTRPGSVPVIQTAGRKTSSRRDPAGITTKASIYKTLGGEWEATKEKAGRGAKEVRPSEVNHGNITPSVQPLGITMEYAEHSIGISLPALRRLRFGTDEKNGAARTYLAALLLLAALEQDTQEYLRSNCDLVPEGVAPWQCVHADGSVHEFEIDIEAARALYRQALEAVVKAGFSMPVRPILLQPQDKVVETIRRCRDAAFRVDESVGAEEE